MNGAKNAFFSITISFIIMAAPNAHADLVSYTLDDIILADGSQMTGSFDWVFDVGDFEGGSGVFTALVIPWRPNGSAPPLEEPGMVLTIENNQIEISLDGNFHDYGLDISLKFQQPLSPTQSSLIDLNTSFFECCGNGFHDQPFVSGSISPIAVPEPGSFLCFGLVGLRLIGRRRRRAIPALPVTLNFLHNRR